ncbi:MAG: hypothetical protein IAE86_15665 [Burkholderiaceae bacterium]|nr:hypothetical protein [Burkholderiaceae bacterium]
MQTPQGYLGKTESAVRRLFDGVDEYLAVLRRATGPVFVSGLPLGPEQDAQLLAWQEANREQLEAARESQREYLAETFALDTLCGAVLQVAAKALEIYGPGTTLPDGLPPEVTARYARLCVGRTIRTLPLGIIVYAARNQHTHFNDELLREPSRSVFKRLATAHGYGKGDTFLDPAFDLSNPLLVSFASNVTALVGWRSYERYIDDMQDMLGPFSQRT